MAKTTNTPAVSYRADNQYAVSRHDMATPYYSAFAAAREAKSTQKVNMPANLKAIYGKGNKAESPKDIPTNYNPVRARRGFWCVLLAILLIVYIAVPAVNFFEVMPEFTSLLEYEAGVDAESGVVTKDYIGTEDVVNGTIWLAEELVAGEEVPAEAAEDVEEVPSEEATADAESVQVSKYYDFVQEGIANGTTSAIMALIFPLGIVLSLITALIFLIRVLVAVFTVKRRKLFVLSGILLFVFTLVGVVGAFLATGAEFGSIMNFIPMLAEEGAVISYQLSLGYIIMAGVSLLALICSLFAFRSKKKVK